MSSSFATIFTTAFGRPPAFCGRAPGRVEFIGNHTDYNGGEVLGAAIDRYVWVAVAPREDTCVRVKTSSHSQTAEADLLDLKPLAGALTWANYPLGVVVEMKAAGVPMPHGFDLYVDSTLPSGAGLSSSAAFEMATVVVLQALYGAHFTTLQQALMAQRAENNFVGVPCGLLDQGVSAFGQTGHLVHLDCAENRITPLALGGEVAFWVFNTNCKHSLVDSQYAVRRQECEAAFAKLQARYPGVDHLAHYAEDTVLASRDMLSPEELARARHITAENARVQAVGKALETGDLNEVGALMAASHASSRDLFANSTPELDALAESLNAHEAVYGARLTGGGFGGAVLAMTRPDFSEAMAEEVRAEYRAKRPTAPEPTVLAVQTADGATLLAD